MAQRKNGCSHSGAIVISDKVDILEPSAEGAIEFLDRHPWLPIVLLLLLPFALHVPLWLLGRSIDPIWYVSGVTQGSQLAPGWPFIDPNAGFTSQALGHLVAWDWLHGIVPWWNQYTGIGMPLAGELQPEAFFLPFNLLLMLPEGVLWQMICLQIIAGLATYALLRELGLSRMAALMGGALFALNGAIAWTPGPSAVYCSLPFLPLLLWGIERARKLNPRKPNQGPVSILAIGIAIGWSILAGFPEPALVSGLLALAWGLYRLASEPGRSPGRWILGRRAIAGFVLGLLVAAPLLISFLDYMRQSNSFAIHNLGEQSLPWAGFSVIVMPYVYGTLTMAFHSQPLAHIWGIIGGYAGIVVILLAVVGLTCKSAHRGLKLLLAGWILLAWAKSFGVQPVMALMNHLPLLRQTSFHRYSPPSWGLALIILAAFGLDDFRKSTPARRGAFGTAMVLLGLGIALAWPQRAFWERPPAQTPLMFALLGVSVVWALAGLFAGGLAWTLLEGERRRVALACLLVFDAAAMFMAPQLSSVRGIRIDTRAMQFLRDHQGLSRTYTLGPMEPNYGAYFQVASIDHNVLPVPKLWANYVDRNLLPGLLTGFSGVSFWPGVYGDGAGEKALSQNLANYLNLGVRYVITNPGESPTSTVSLPAADTNTRSTPLSRLLDWSYSIVGNRAKPAIERFIAKELLKMVHSPGRSVDGKAVETGNAQPAAPRIGQPTSENSVPLPRIHKVYTDSVMDIWELPNPAPYFQVTHGGPCTFLTMRREDVTAECSAPAILLRRELYMPGWRVMVNGTRAGTVQQAGLFQAAALPAGRSHARYRFVPPYMQFGWVAGLLGLAGLMWQIILIGRSSFIR